jgi:hypothetical protein
MPQEAMLLNIIFFVTNGLVNLGRVFVFPRPFQPSPLLVGKARSPLKLKDASLSWAWTYLCTLD